MEFTMTGHMSSVTSVRWGGQGLIFSGSEDRTIKVWDPIKGILCRSLDGHAHWMYLWEPSKSKKPICRMTGHVQVFAVDWSSDGSRVASGSKDCSLKLWRY
ncbi:WD40-repeat-containing domain protein [Baffinella frigidus]|nr:WD40-repeat-containing domain protein [Cryptophyta sp. CCMP2293]